MPAPKRPNTAAATHAAQDKSRRRKMMALAAELQAYGGEVVLPFASARSGEHVFRVETRPAGEQSAAAWKADCADRDPIWYTLTGAAVRVAELERRGLEARMA